MWKRFLKGWKTSIRVSVLGSISGLLWLLPRRRHFPPPPPQKLLLANFAHLGDVILTTSLLPALKEAFPLCEIGMLVASGSRKVIEGHPLVSRIHLFDHWKWHRMTFREYLRRRKQLLVEIKDYDTAIDLRFHFPNSTPLLWRAKIPVRMGFTSPGFAPLLTHALPWNQKIAAVASFYSLLSFFGLSTEPRRPCLPPVHAEKGDYIVVHVGSRDSNRHLHLEQWRAILAPFRGRKLIFTGEGKKQHAMIEEIIRGNPDAENHCDAYSWQECVKLVKGASYLLCVETSIGHIASAVETPALIFYVEKEHAPIWKPWGEDIYSLDVRTLSKKE